jgi:hypothetical protein
MVIPGEDGKFSKRRGDPHIVIVFWIPAFAGMPGDRYFS